MECSYTPLSSTLSRGTLPMDTLKQQGDGNLPCRYCQHPLVPQARFCPHCGVPVVSREPDLRLVAMKEPEPILVFFSYAHRDRYLCRQLENHLSNLKYRGIITTWHAREINAGHRLL